MGPLRRGLIAALVPGAASAEVCDKLRPLWQPGTPATAVDELIALMAAPPSLILLLLTAVALRYRHQWGGLLVVVLWSGWLTVVVAWQPAGEINKFATKEGCIGSPDLFIAAVIAISIATILYTAPRRSGDN